MTAGQPFGPPTGPAQFPPPVGAPLPPPSAAAPTSPAPVSASPTPRAPFAPPTGVSSPAPPSATTPAPVLPPPAPALRAPDAARADVQDGSSPWSGDSIPADSTLDEVSWPDSDDSGDLWSPPAADKRHQGPQPKPATDPDRVVALGFRHLDPADESSTRLRTDLDERARAGHPSDSSDAGRPGWVGAAAVAAVVAITVGAVTLPGNDSSGPAATPSTIDQFPPGIPDQTVPPPPTTIVFDAPDGIDTEFDTEDGTDRSIPVDYRLVDLPPELLAITEPTEVVGLTTRGELITLAIPSGAVQIVQIPELSDAGGGQISVTPTFTLVSDGNTLIVVLPDGTLVPVDPDELRGDGDFFGVEVQRSGWFRRADGTDVAFATVFGGGPEARTITVDRNGVVSSAGSIESTGFVVSDGGRRVVIDAGGSYLLDDQGNAQRITDGQTFAINERFALQRRCNEILQCEYGVADLETDEFRVTDALLDSSSFFGEATISPDGQALAFIGGDRGERRILVLDGEVLGGVQAEGFGSGWAADSSGEFILGNGQQLVFQARGDGAITSVPITVGGTLSSIGVRPGTTIDTTLAVEPAPLPTPTESGLQVLVLSASGAITALDLDSGSLSTWFGPEIAGAAPPSLTVLGDQVLVRQGNPVDGGFVTELGDVVEVIDGVNMPDINGPTLPDSDVISTVGDDRALAEVADQIVLLDDGTFPLIDGDLLAFGGRFALVQTCDGGDDGECDFLLDDVYAGTNEAVTPALDLLVPLPAAVPRAVSLENTISPDGRAALIQVRVLAPGGEELERWALVELDGSRSPIVVGSPVGGLAIAWSDDGRVAAFISDGALRIWDRDSGAVLDGADLGSDLRAVVGIGPAFGLPIGSSDSGS